MGYLFIFDLWCLVLCKYAKSVSFFIFSVQRKGSILVSPMAELVGPRIYSCYNCRNHVALHDDVISKAFQVKIILFIYFLISILDCFSNSDIGL